MLVMTRSNYQPMLTNDLLYTPIYHHPSMFFRGILSVRVILLLSLVKIGAVSILTIHPEAMSLYWNIMMIDLIIPQKKVGASQLLRYFMFLMIILVFMSHILVISVGLVTPS